MATHDDLTKIRSEVNEQKVRLTAVETLMEQFNKSHETQNENIKELTKGLSKLDKKFTIFITALVVSVSFGDPIANALLKLII